MKSTAQPEDKSHQIKEFYNKQIEKINSMNDKLMADKAKEIADLNALNNRLT